MNSTSTGADMGERSYAHEMHTSSKPLNPSEENMISTSTQSESQRHTIPPTPPDSDSEKADDDDPSQEHETTPDFPLPPTTTEPTQVLSQDEKTPDSWLPRDPRLIRLTGVHPFNVEAPLTDLFNQGFLTSPELFYVRNHGHVPRVQDSEIFDWEFSIEGLVEKPMTLSLRQLLSDFDQQTYPITLVCAGNRRKEQNVVRKTKGFSWGAAGVSTALFTGVLMADVIRRACPKRGARFVCMEGADKLPNGYYGTSVKLNWVMDPNRGMMLAHGMNGEMLRPDHGKPLRAVIPGQIGGRSVKWLKKLIVTAEPSENWYHIYDNRVLPTMVSPEEAAGKPEWWTDERYAIYDLSTNSAIACPAHDERIAMTEEKKSYSMKGYAYAGGGRRVTRVELSLDQGRSWRLANIDYAEDRYRDATPQTLYGGTMDFGWREASFCWCFWDLEVALSDLTDAKDVLVRAMDESMNLQPRDMYWSVLGMMNNPWYRVAICREGDELRFEHPTQPALIPGGWMERVKKAGGDLSNGYWGENVDGKIATEAVAEPKAEVKMTKDGVDKAIALDELRQHENEESPWFVVNGEVYDGTAFLKEHPGGATSITAAAGQDCSDEFMAIHSETAKLMLPDYHIGSLSREDLAALNSSPSSSESASESATFLNPRSWTTATLKDKTALSTDTYLFTLRLSHSEQTLGLPIGQHLLLRLRDPVTREAIIRAYTPISSPSRTGTVEVLIKLYDTGRMSKALNSLPLGHGLDFKGPVGAFEYLGRGRCNVQSVGKKNVQRFYMLCAGSGITPIYQVLAAVASDVEDSTECVVIDGNRSEGDILCREQLDMWSQRERCEVLHTLSKPSDAWNGVKGRISEALLKERVVKEEGVDAMVLICGPDQMVDGVKGWLANMGWGGDEVHVF